MAARKQVYLRHSAIEAPTFLALPINKSEQVRISFIFQKGGASTRLETRKGNQNDERLPLKDSIRGKVGNFKHPQDISQTLRLSQRQG